MNRKLKKTIQTASIFFVGVLLASCAEFTDVFQVQPSPHSLADQEGFYYDVKAGDTLLLIAQTFGVSLQALAEINDIAETSELNEGERIFVPVKGARKNLALDARKKPVPSAGALEKPEIDTSRFIWPLKGQVSSRFGVRGGRLHDGIDISAPRGTEVSAAARGKVVYSGRLSGYGNLIILKHASGFFTAYAHLSKSKVVKGGKVEQGQVIGLVGATGRASGPHCHFEIRQKTEARNPLFFLPENKNEVAETAIH